MKIKESLTFFHVKELRQLAKRLGLVDKGSKMEIILRILHFLQTGEKLTVPKFPEISCAKCGGVYPIGKNELMLKGAYKNDLKTRNFFKGIIGEHFHFTAFGIDWLNEQWMNGNPPTYEAFALMWQKRKEMTIAPKEEWAYINFVQKFLLSHPKASRKSINEAWEGERARHKAVVYDWLADF